MTPVEGCPSVFQTICSLPPGYHQVSFLLHVVSFVDMLLVKSIEGIKVRIDVLRCENKYRMMIMDRIQY